MIEFFPQSKLPFIVALLVSLRWLSRVVESDGFLTVCIITDHGDGSEINIFSISIYPGTTQGYAQWMFS